MKILMVVPCINPDKFSLLNTYIILKHHAKILAIMEG